MVVFVTVATEEVNHYLTLETFVSPFTTHAQGRRGWQKLAEILRAFMCFFLTFCTWPFSSSLCIVTIVNSGETDQYH